MNNQPVSTKETSKNCSICGGDYYGMGNNAWPVNPGRCCDECNDIVIAHRMRNVARGLNAYADPQWYQDVVTSVTEFWQAKKEVYQEKTPQFKGWEAV